MLKAWLLFCKYRINHSSARGFFIRKLPTGAGERSAAMRRADAGAGAPDEPTVRCFGNSGTVVYI